MREPRVCKYARNLAVSAAYTSKCGGDPFGLRNVSPAVTKHVRIPAVHLSLNEPLGRNGDTQSYFSPLSETERNERYAKLINVNPT